AEEVRSLAIRSAEAAKQTAQLIEDAVRHASEGVTVNAQASHGLRQVQAEIVAVRAAITDIAAASARQHDGVARITAEVEQMNGVTQQVAANAEESAAAAEELNSQSLSLREMVGGFTLSAARS
ncbi:MAG TPA: methyl-accepting chemotaxis protein, partial [Gemmatimonadaceae bacterium]|nr:methyl-accepting chemotaxis protein [Gemmatimonadaceae bacterium]